MQVSQSNFMSLSERHSLGYSSENLMSQIRRQREARAQKFIEDARRQNTWKLLMAQERDPQWITLLALMQILSASQNLDCSC